VIIFYHSLLYGSIRMFSVKEMDRKFRIVLTLSDNSDIPALWQVVIFVLVSGK
jgi:hypothetical protein